LFDSHVYGYCNMDGIIHDGVFLDVLSSTK